MAGAGESAAALAQGAQPETSEVSQPVESSRTRGPELSQALVAASLLGLLGVAFMYAAQLTFRAAWASDFLRANKVAAEARGLLLRALCASALVGAAGATVAVLLRRRRGKSAAGVAHLAWGLSPFACVAFLPMFLRQAPWSGRTTDLLVSTGAAALLFEGSLLRAIPAWQPLLRRYEALRVCFLPALTQSRREWIARSATLLAAVSYTVWMSALAIRRHHNLQSGVYDLGISDNLMYNALAGHFMRSPIFSGVGEGALNFLANHAQFGQYVLLPFYALSPRAETLLILQAASLGMAAVPLYFFARRYLPRGASVAVALAYLCYPAVHGASLFEMTYLPIATFFVVSAIWALDAGRWVLFGLAFASALSMREDVPIGLAVAGVFFTLSGRRPTAGLLMAVLSTLYFVLVRFVVMDRAGSWVFPDIVYGDLMPENETASFGAVIRTVVTNPVFVLPKLLTEQKFLYLLQLLVPIAFIPIRRGWALAALVPGALLTLLSNSGGAIITVGFHYALHWVPYLFLMTPPVLRSLGGEGQFGARGRAAAAGMMFASLVMTYQLGALGHSPAFRVGFSNHDFGQTVEQADAYHRMKRIVAVIPPQASVSGSNTIGPHVSNRVEAYLLDNEGPQHADYIACARYDFKYGQNRRWLREALERGQYGVIAYDADYVVLQSGAPVTDNAPVLDLFRP